MTPSKAPFGTGGPPKNFFLTHLPVLCTLWFNQPELHDALSSCIKLNTNEHDYKIEV